jgi:hypothetical protein
MRERTAADRIPATIDEAEAGGWCWLECRCPNGCNTVHLPWRLLQMRTGRSSIAEITRRVNCERCGAALGKFALVRLVEPTEQSPTTVERLVLDPAAARGVSPG